MATAHIPFMTPAQYLEIGRRAETRSEYLHGVMFAMAGTSLSPVRIVSNAVVQLLSDYDQATDIINLEAIDCKLTLASLYERVEFTPTA